MIPSLNKTTLIVFLALIVHVDFAQSKTGVRHEIDDIISVALFSENFSEMDTVLDGMDIHQVYTNDQSATYIIQNTTVEKEDVDRDLSKLPYDINSLKAFYEELGEGIISNLPYELASEDMFTTKKIIGYRMRLQNSDDSQIGEVQLYLLNKQLYTFYYIDPTNYNSAAKDLFFNSIQINNEAEISQFIGHSREYRLGYLFGQAIAYIIIIVFVIWLIRKSSKKKHPREDTV